MDQSISESFLQEEIDLTELTEELEAVRRLVKNLQAYLEKLQVFREGLQVVNANCKQLMKVNVQWIDIVNTMNDPLTVPYVI